jgi:hypothetical protein
MHELLQEHSSQADLVVMTLPVPHKNTDRCVHCYFGAKWVQICGHYVLFWVL